MKPSPDSKDSVILCPVTSTVLDANLTDEDNHVEAPVVYLTNLDAVREAIQKQAAKSTGKVLDQGNA